MKKVLAMALMLALLLPCFVQAGAEAEAEWICSG